MQCIVEVGGRVWMQADPELVGHVYYNLLKN